MNKLEEHVFYQFVAVISISLDQGTHFKMIAAQQWATYHLVIWPLPIIFNSQGNNIKIKSLIKLFVLKSRG